MVAGLSPTNYFSAPASVPLPSLFCIRGAQVFTVQSLAWRSKSNPSQHTLSPFSLSQCSLLPLASTFVVFRSPIMTRKRQRLDSVVAPPATAQERNLEAIGDFKLHSRLVAATKAVARKKLHATAPGDLLALETE